MNESMISSFDKIIYNSFKNSDVYVSKGLRNYIPYLKKKYGNNYTIKSIGSTNNLLNNVIIISSKTSFIFSFY